MEIRVVTLRYSEGVQGFPEDALRRACAGREILDVSENFFVYGNVPHLSLTLKLGGEAVNGAGWKNRYIRGGNWNNDASNCASSNRNNNTPSNRNNNNGFRLFSTVIARSEFNSAIPEPVYCGTNASMASPAGRRDDLAQSRAMLYISR